MVKTIRALRKINAILQMLRLVNKNWQLCVVINWQQMDKISSKET